MLWTAIALGVLWCPLLAYADTTHVVNTRYQLVALVQKTYGRHLEWLADNVLRYNKVKRVQRATTVVLPDDAFVLFCLESARPETIKAVQALLAQSRRYETEVVYARPPYQPEDAAKWLLAGSEIEKQLADIQSTLEIERTSGLPPLALNVLKTGRSWLQEMSSLRPDQVVHEDRDVDLRFSKYSVGILRHISYTLRLVVHWLEKGTACHAAPTDVKR